ncbi:hypothetical protein Tco_0962695 [Tanacetum coccineum]
MRLSIEIPKRKKLQEIGYSDPIEATSALKKSCLPPRWQLLMAQIIQCLRGKTGGYDQITNKDAMILYCLENRVKIRFAKLIWDDLLSKLKKKQRERVVNHSRPSVLKMGMRNSKLPNLLSQLEGRYPKVGKARTGLSRDLRD